MALEKSKLYIQFVSLVLVYSADSWQNFHMSHDISPSILFGICFFEDLNLKFLSKVQGTTVEITTGNIAIFHIYTQHIGLCVCVCMCLSVCTNLHNSCHIGQTLDLLHPP